MAKKKDNNAGNISGNAQKTPVATGISGDISFRSHALIAGGIAVLVWLVFRVSLDNQLTDWDDAGYIVNNPLVKDITAKGLKNIFTEPVMGNYHPITILSYAIEYSMVELQPWLYHFDSLLLHVLTTITVYIFAAMLLKRPPAAAVTALLFGLTPMHVESAAWVAGRKDLFCALFYIGACIAYIQYLRCGKNKKWYVLTLAMFVCALLSKPVAVTLPLVLLLIDMYEGQSINAQLLIEKVPHFLLSVIAGAISVVIQHGGGAMNAHKEYYNVLERIALGCYALLTYLWKAVLPLQLRCFYAYPAKVNGSIPYIYYLAPVAVIVLLYLAWRYCRNSKTAVFGILFFIVNMLLLVQFIPVGDAIIAERYSYMSYTGLFLIAGWGVSQLTSQEVKKTARDITVGIVAIFLAVFAYASHERCKVWYDPISLWSDEIEKEPSAPLSYNNIGYIYFTRSTSSPDPNERAMARDSAFYFMQKAVEHDPQLVNPYQGMGMISYMRGDFPTSAYYFKIAMKLSPSAENRGDYANLLVMLHKQDSALMQFDTAVSLNPNVYPVRLNRGKLLKDMGRCKDAVPDLAKAIELNTAAGEAYYLRSVCLAAGGDTVKALQDADKAIALGFAQVDNAYYSSLKRR